MAVRELIVFKHSKELGDCPAYKLFDAVKVQKNDDIQYPRKYQDYTVTINDDEIPDTGRSEKDDLMEYSQDDYLMISEYSILNFAEDNGRLFMLSSSGLKMNILLLANLCIKKRMIHI